MCNPMGFYSDRKFYPAAAHAQSGVRLSLSVCQQKSIEMYPKCSFSCLQRACGQRKSYLLYVHNASGRSIRLYSLPFKPLHIYRALAITSLRRDDDVFAHAHMKSLPRGNEYSSYRSSSSYSSCSSHHT